MAQTRKAPTKKTAKKPAAKKVPNKTRSKAPAPKKRGKVKCTPKQAETITKRVEQNRKPREQRLKEFLNTEDTKQVDLEEAIEATETKEERTKRLKRERLDRIKAERIANPLQGEALEEARRKKEFTGNPVGRPTVMTDTVIDEILSRIEAGETLTNICKDQHMPDLATVMLFKRKNPVFFSEYVRARENAADVKFDRIIELSQQVNPGNAHAIRTEIDAIKWWIGKVKPKDYSDKIIHAGHDGGPLTLNWAKVDTDSDTVIDVTPNQPDKSISYGA